MYTLKAQRRLPIGALSAALAIFSAVLVAPGKAAAQSISPPIACSAATGTAGAFACEGVDLLAIVPSYELSQDLCDLNDPAESPWNPIVDPDNPDQSPTPLTGSDMWGWTHHVTDENGERVVDENGDFVIREFALQGLSDVVAFIEMTDPVNPVFVGCMPAPTPNFLWRDVKVYNDHVYVVGDFSPELVAIAVDENQEEQHDHEQASAAPQDFVHGLQIFDLKRLLTVDQSALDFKGVRFKEDAVYEGFDEAHNIVINEETGFATAVASDTCSGEFHMLDLSEDPVYPEFLGCFNSKLDGAVHDAQCITYQGEDFEHFGKEICLAFMEDQFAIIDMSKPSKPEVLTGNNTYEGLAYVHQGWFTDDFRYVLSNDEQDEMYAQAFGGHVAPIGTRTYVWDVQDLDNPIFKGYFSSPTLAIDHNMYFKGEFLHQANYTSGYRILKFDPSRIDENPDGEAGLEQVAFFDTVPSGPAEVDGPAFGGVWSGYFYFKNDAVALSQLNNGELFILRPQDEAINNAGKTDDPVEPEDPTEPVDMIPEEGRVHGSGYMDVVNNDDGDSDSEKVDFSFNVKVKEKDGARTLDGKLKLKDKALDIKIEAEEITSLILGGQCNGVTADDNFIFRATGSLNAAENIEFRVCGQDNGKHGKGKDGQPADRFFLECLSAGCSYNTADRTTDDGIDGGNIHLHDPIVMAESSSNGGTGAASADSGSSSGDDQMVITLDPLLQDNQMVGLPMTLTAVVETTDGASLEGRTLTLHSKHQNGATYASSVVSDALGNAVFSITPLQGDTAYWVSLDGIESNRVTLTGISGQ